MARCETFLMVEPAIFLPPKTQQVVQSKTDFDELELDIEPRNMICQVCKGLSSPQECDQVTNLRAPLDSTPIYPIALSRSYLCLDHSTWVGLWLSWSLQVGHLSWLRVQSLAWWRLLQILPHAHNGRVSLSFIFMYPLQAPSIGSFRESFSWSCTTHLFFTKMMSWIFKTYLQ